MSNSNKFDFGDTVILSLSKFERRRKYILALLYSSIGSVFLSLTAYPGFMSYDSIHMVREARSVVEGYLYPTLPVYIFRIFDFSGNGNAYQFVIQNLVVLTCFNIILARVRVSWGLVLLANILVLSNPLTMGAMLVLWKDVTLLALVLLVMVVLVWKHTGSEEHRFRGYSKWIILIFIFLTAAMRLNALPLAFGLFSYWLVVFYPTALPRVKIFLVTVLTIGAFFFTGLLQTIGFPEMNTLRPSPNLQALMASDLVGISYFAEKTIVPFASKLDPEPELIPISTIESVYTNYGGLVMKDRATAAGLDFNIFPKNYDETDLRQAWVSSVISYPREYLQYRLDIFGAIIGTTVERTYEPTHYNTIDENDLGISFTMRPITQMVLQYIFETSGSPIFMPATVWIFATLLLGLLLIFRLKKNFLSSLANSIYVLGLVYLIPYIFLPGTGEVRYAFPSTFLFFISISLSLQVVWSSWLRWGAFPHRGNETKV